MISCRFTNISKLFQILKNQKITITGVWKIIPSNTQEHEGIINSNSNTGKFTQHTLSLVCLVYSV